MKRFVAILIHHSVFRPPLRGVTGTLLCYPFFLFPLTASAADIVVDPASPSSQKTQVTTANNGVPLIQIAAPNARGLSHNQYTDFNVTSQGLILNNAQSATTSQLGGAVLANPNLQQAGATANIILNEVTSNNRSRLEGFQEVAGDRADLILANPNGITCQGCGFINTPRATLATGKPLVDNGNLQGFDIRGGDILIEGAGANARAADAFDLITRRLRIEGVIHGQEVNLITGANRIDYATRNTSALASSEDAPGYLIDSSGLGGVFANRIFLLGNEQGVGVRLRGDMATSVGEIALQNDGRIELDGNSLSASSDLNIDTGGSELAVVDATLFGQQDLSLNSGNLTMTRSTAFADSQVEVSTTANLTLTDATIGSHGSLTMAVNDHLQLQGSLVASDHSLAIEATTLNVDGTSQGGKGIVSEGDLAIKTTSPGSTIVNEGDILGHNVTLQAPRFILNLETGLLSGDNLVTFDNLINYGQVVGARIERTDGDLTTANFGEFLAGAGGIRLPGSLTNHPGALLHAVGDIDLGGPSATIRNERARIESYSGAITLSGNLFENIGAAPSLIWDYANDQTVTHGWFTYDGVTIPIYSECGSYADHFDSDRVGHRCARSIRRTYQEVGSGQLPDPAQLLAAGNIRFSGDELVNEQGIIAAGGDITIDANRFTNSTKRRLTRDTTFNPDQNYHSGYTGYKYQAGDKVTWLSEPCVSNGSACFSDGLGAVIKEFGIIDATRVWDSGHGPVDPSWGGVVQAGGTLNINATQVQNGHEPTGGASFNGSAPASPTLPGVSSGLPDRGSLFVPVQDPGAVVLIETDPRFNLDQLLQGFAGSQLLLDQLNGQDLTGQTSETVRLGDAYYETLLVRDELMQLTGMRFIYDDLATDVAQFQQLMDNALVESRTLDLRVGVALDQDQISKLAKDIVWMVETEYEGRRVLRPKVYLTEHTLARLGRGETLTARNIEIDAAGAFTNAGTLRASGSNRVSTGTFTNRGVTEGGTSVSISATDGDLRNSGLIRGGDVSLTAQTGDVINENLARREQLIDGYVTREGARGGIEASGDLLMQGENLTLQGGTSTSATGRATLNARQDVNLQAQAYSDERRSSITQRSGLWGISSKKTTRIDRTTRIEGASLSGAGGVSISAGRDVDVTASRINSASGGIAIEAGRRVAIETAKEEVYDLTTETSRRILSDSRAEATGQDRLSASASADIYNQQSTTRENRDETVISSQLQAESGITIISGDKSTLRSAELNTRSGPIRISGSEVELLAAQESDLHRTDSDSLTVGVAASADSRDQFAGFKGRYEGEKTTTTITTHQTNRLESGGDISISAHQGNVREQGSELSAVGAIDVSARSGSVISEAVKDSITTTRETETAGGELGVGARTGIASDLETTVRNDPTLTHADPNTLDAESSAVSSGTLYYGGRAGGDYQTSDDTQLDETVKTSRWKADGDIAVTAGDDLVLQATQLNSDTGDIGLQAEGQIRIEAVTDRHESHSERLGGQGELIASKNSGTLAGHYNNQSESERLGIARTASIIAGGDLSIQAGEDLTATGVTGQADGDVSLKAGGNLALNAAHDTYEHSRKGMAADGRLSLKRNMKTGAAERVYDLNSGGVVNRQSKAKGGALEGQYRGVDERTTGDIARASGFTAGGDMSLQAQEDVNLEGSRLTAGGDGEITALNGDINYRAVEDRFTTERDNLQVYGKLSGAKNKDTSAGPAATSRAGKAWGNFGVARGKVSEFTMKYKQDGATVDRDRADNETVQARGGEFRFGGDSTLKAGGDINLQGTQGTAGGKMEVDAEGDLNLLSAESLSRIDSDSLSSGAGLRQTGLLTESTDIDSVRHQNTRLQADDMTARSGGDTLLAGGSIEGDAVHTEVGGDLTIVSKVDWVEFEVREQGVIFGTAVGENGGGRLDGFGQVIHAIEHAPEHVKTSDQVERGRIETLSSPSGIRIRANRDDVATKNSDAAEGHARPVFFNQEILPILERQDDKVREKIEQQRQ